MLIVDIITKIFSPRAEVGLFPLRQMPDSYNFARVSARGRGGTAGHLPGSLAVVGLISPRTLCPAGQTRALTASHSSRSP